MNLDVISWTNHNTVRFLDQTLLPKQEIYREASTIDEMVEAIRMLRVRGAPLIGISAAMGLAAAAAGEAEAGTLVRRRAVPGQRAARFPRAPQLTPTASR